MSAFDNQETPEQNPESQSVFSDQLKNIINESGEQKYDSVEKALEALKHSQSYIPELKSTLSQKDQEIEALKAELQKKQAIEEVVEKLTAKQADQSSNPQASGLDEQAVLNLVQSSLQQKEQESTLAANEKSVSDALSATFGEKTKEMVAAKAAELGMTVADLQELSRKSPSAALNLFQVQASPQPKTTTSSININSGLSQAEGLTPPEKSLMRGASTKDQVEYLRKVREHVYKKFNVEEV